jgi:hypothetical protein
MDGPGVSVRNSAIRFQANLIVAAIFCKVQHSNSLFIDLSSTLSTGVVPMCGRTALKQKFIDQVMSLLR